MPLCPLDLGVLEEVADAGDIVTPVHGRDDLERPHHPPPVIHDPDRMLGGKADGELAFVALDLARPRPASHREAPTLGLAQDIIGCPLAAGGPAAAPTHPLVDDPGIDLAELPEAHPPPVARPRA